MTERQRAIFWAMRFEDVDYPTLGHRHGISAEEVEAEFAAALTLFMRIIDTPEPW